MRHANTTINTDGVVEILWLSLQERITCEMLAVGYSQFQLVNVLWPDL